mmetsp:Transcript_12931/g.27943  ORF Transcript_12931/g.27943 Transcript_12931/m.27943 type:complete len:82 (-) Transcript_12931:24-269(-)
MIGHNLRQLTFLTKIFMSAANQAPYAETLSVTSLTAHDATVATGQMWLLLIACGVLEVAGRPNLSALLSAACTSCLLLPLT